MLILVKLANLVFLNNATDTNMVEVSAMSDICIFAPGTLTGTINVQVSPDNVTFYNLKSAGSDVTIAINAAIIIVTGGFQYLRLHSGSAEGAERTFKATMQERAP